VSIKEELPKGVCNKCGMPRMTREGQVICPNCDTLGGDSKLLNDVKDPGEAGFKKVTNSKGFDEMLPLSMPFSNSISVTDFNNINTPIMNQEVSLESQEVKKLSGYNYIIQEINFMPMPSNMKDIKKLLKIKQLLQELNNKEL